VSLTVIIPTTCETARGQDLGRAIESVAGQLPAGGCVLVVANGSRVDDVLLRELQSRPGVRTERLREGSVAAAQRLGRASVRTEFFCFLDDDDEYLPGAVATRIDALRADAAIDVVVTNGLRAVDAGEVPVVRDVAGVRADPLRALLAENWLASCAGTFRTTTIGEEVFDGRTRFFEWTLIAYRIASARRVVFVDAATYRIHSSGVSASKSEAYEMALPGVLATIAALDLPDDVRRGVRAKIADAEHAISMRYLEAGDRGRALRHHVRSLLARGGVKFLPYSRQLIRSRARYGAPTS
jgi:hypothetical protein